jgi:hypothetical protein
MSKTCREAEIGYYPDEMPVEIAEKPDSPQLGRVELSVIYVFSLFLKYALPIIGILFFLTPIVLFYLFIAAFMEGYYYYEQVHNVPVGTIMHIEGWRVLAISHGTATCATVVFGYIYYIIIVPLFLKMG